MTDEELIADGWVIFPGDPWVNAAALDASAPDIAAAVMALIAWRQECRDRLVAERGK